MKRNIIIIMISILAMAGIGYARHQEPVVSRGQVTWPQMWNGTSFYHPELDAMTRSGVIISEGHHNIHDGISYSYNYTEADVDSGETVGITFATPPADSGLVHMFYEISGNKETGVSIYENGISEGTGGTLATIYNRDRNSLNTSSSFIYEEGSWTPGSGITLLGNEIFGVGSGPFRIGGNTRDADETIWKSSTTYFITLESRAEDNIIHIKLNWYKKVTLAN